MQKSKISVITVSFNAEQCIERTIISVLGQNYANIEYLIIDGGSTDGTIGIVEKYKDRISLVVSEPDKGIYDAMNKGIKLASGEWVNFMNAGDLFNSASTLSDIFDAGCQHNGCSVIYGKTLLSLSYAKYIVEAEPLEILNYRMPFCHQSCFVKRDVLLNNLFDLNYQVVSDHNQFLRLYRAGVKFLYVPIVVSQYFPEGGFSILHSVKAFRESAHLTGRDKMRLYRFDILKLRLKNGILKMLPGKYLNKMRMAKYSSNPRFSKYE